MSDTSQTSKPTTLIVHGANIVGLKLTELLSTQKSHIIAIDEFTRTNKEILKRLKQECGADVYDMSAITTLTTKIKRADYIVILLDQFLTVHSSLTSKQFLSETNSIDAIFKLALEQNAKVVLTTSIRLHRRIVSQEIPSRDTLKVSAEQHQYTHIELQRYCENLAAEYHDQASLNIRITRLGEVIGEGISLDSDTLISQMIKESITKPRITIPGEGLDYTFYVHHLDAVYGIIKALFSNKTDGEVFSLSYPDEVSSLNLAYKILELNPKAAEIVFAEAPPDSLPQHTYVPAKNLSKIGWATKVPFEQALLETMTYFHEKYNVMWKNKPSTKEMQTERPKPAPKPTKHRSDTVTPLGSVLKSITSPIGYIRSMAANTKEKLHATPITPKRIAILGSKILGAFFLFFFVVGPIFQIAAGGAGTYYYGKKGYSEAYSLNTTLAESDFKKATDYSSLLRTGWGGLRWISYMPFASDFYAETAKLISAGNHLTNGGYYLVKGFSPYATYFKNFQPITSFGSTSGGGSREYVQELSAMDEGIPYIKSASIEISLAQKSISSVDTSVYPSYLSGMLEELTTKTARAEDSVSKIEDFAYYIPEILGKDERKTYAVIFQNPMELRSTGGWLTSVALVGIEHGQVRELEVKDVYDIDSQITEEIQLPDSMQQALNITNWTLSLSNWFPDFPQSAEAAEYFLQLSDDAPHIDGVIAVDLEFVRNLIGIWGSIQVPGESEPVTQDNLYDKVIEIHRAFTPGSTAKPTFLSNLSNEIMRKILSSPRESWTGLASNIQEGLDEKHVLVYLHNTQIREFMDNNGWSGRLSPSINSVFPVEWNWGGNKANYFLTRSTSLTVDIQNENSIQQTLAVSYQNSSTTDTYPEGDYLAFVRVYLPQGIVVKRVEGLSTVRVAQDTLADVTVVSGWITVPTQDRASYSVSYLLTKDTVTDFPLTYGTSGLLSYELNVIKQPGLNDDPLTIEVTYPEGWTPTDLSNIRRELNALIQRSDLARDLHFTLSWER